MEKSLEKPPDKVANAEVKQQSPALEESKSSNAGETKRATEKPLVTEKAQQPVQAKSSVYPALARRRQQQGTVWVDVRLDAQGRQIGLQVLRSSGVKSLDQAALTAVKQWQFLPERQSGVGVPSRVHIPIEFAIAAKP